LRLQLSLAMLLWCGVALADPPPAADPPLAADPTSAPADPSDAPGAANRNDVLAEDPNVKPTRPADAGEPPTGTIRTGVYHDSDQTTVWRVLGVIGQTLGQWSVTGSIGIDAVSSASVDVRSSPALSAVDVVTSASGRSSTSGGEMTDTRYQATAGAGWKGSDGRAVNLTSAVAKETDYASVSGGLNGSFDVLDRTTTLLGGFTLTDNWVSSVIDSTLHHKMFAAAWSAGVARVLTPDDAIRLRYDGRLSEGYLSSPYRNVRFGDWMATLGQQQITFTNTIGSVAGLPERVPDSRLGTAAVLEWVHSLWPGVGLHPETRLSHDSWGVDSVSAGVDLRIARKTWRLQTGYRFYLQSHADFFLGKYVDAPATYAFYTSDKELGEQIGHLAQLDLSIVLIDGDAIGDSRLMFNMQLDAVHYSYPGFVLLPSRDSVFASVGLSWEL
jgi:hypothetical protein